MSAQSQAADFKHVRNCARTIELREALGHFIRAGWTPSELAEHVSTVSRTLGQTKVPALSYRIVLQRGADHEDAKGALATMRASEPH